MTDRSPAPDRSTSTQATVATPASSSPTIDSATFRAVLGRFASGVTVVTVRGPDARDHGMTVSAFCSVSLEPPLVLACIERTATLLPVLAVGGAYAITMLSESQEALSRRFASDVDDRFDGIGYRRGPRGSALLDDALAWLECRVEARVDAGDHVVVIGRVEFAEVSDRAGPLLYYRSGYGRLER
jgi:flavin reductase (DIM6/NTAB) family NADH-FMN oxidoreductase RutF